MKRIKNTVVAWVLPAASNVIPVNEDYADVERTSTSFYGNCPLADFVSCNPGFFQIIQKVQKLRPNVLQRKIEEAWQSAQLFAKNVFQFG